MKWRALAVTAAVVAAVAGAAACFPNARLERVPAAGHSVYFERPARFNELVAAFLAE